VENKKMEVKEVEEDIEAVDIRGEDFLKAIKKQNEKFKERAEAFRKKEEGRI
tara:strand:- start:108 stop:263 length:156 start_codon:yes stop_codon:yes gene_type:complete